MFCNTCGKQVQEGARYCDGCGKPIASHASPPAGGQAPPPYGGHPGGQAHHAAAVPNYLAQAILVTLFCCLPFGVVSIVYAAQVNGKLAVGDIAGARSASESAKTWAWVSFGVGLIAAPFLVLLSLASS